MQKTQKPKKEEKVYKLSPRVTTPSLDMSIKFKADKSVQFTSLFVRTYATTEEVERLVEVLKPDEYAYIVHDKDKLPSGELKERHIHLLLYKKSQMRLTKLLTFTEANTRVEIPRSKKYAYEYLTHKNDPDKTPYPKADIHEYHERNNTFEVTLQEQRENRNLELLDDINNLTRRQMAEKYGSDYIKNYQRYESFMQVVKSDEMIDECNALASEANPQEEFFSLTEMNSDSIHLTLSDYVCLQIRELMESFRMPTADEIVHIYYEVLQKARDNRNRLARELRVDPECLEVSDLCEYM